MEYQPGVCNIGPAERRKRLLLGVASLLGSVVLVAAVLAVGWPLWTLLFVLFPLYGAAMGFLQYRERFCVGFAGIGVFDVGGGTHEITDPQALEADRKHAVRLNTKALAVGAVGALAAYGIALLVVG
ncbi:hypothetical protein GRS48_12950 [Halorubrum sp. JWXQ-INN 858]|uniref:hypothetical protein n=1 Tax=Halorubrum sp. JWXQ-INN 858 TaxID=2690782 RepID=UPI00135B67B0|nr:hypothetical protein [Halorubrum sp. JWXQ-INN 858]MWV65721.1 hypothetical protein [Halorubrum sp. JWXQ-INN 858]